MKDVRETISNRIHHGIYLQIYNITRSQLSELLNSVVIRAIRIPHHDKIQKPVYNTVRFYIKSHISQ